MRKALLLLFAALAAALSAASPAYADPPSLQWYLSWHCDPSPVFAIAVTNPTDSTVENTVYLGDLPPQTISIAASGREAAPFVPSVNGTYQLIIKQGDNQVASGNVQVACTRLKGDAGNIPVGPAASEAPPAAMPPATSSASPPAIAGATIGYFNPMTVTGGVLALLFLLGVLGCGIWKSLPARRPKPADAPTQIHEVIQPTLTSRR